MKLPINFHQPELRILRDMAEQINRLISAMWFTESGSTGAGMSISKLLTNTATLNFGSIAANTTATLTITVTGAAVGDHVILVPPSTLEDGVIHCGGVTAADTVCVRLHNTSGGAIDPASATWRATVMTIE